MLMVTMSRVLSDLLGAKEPVFTQLLKDLEREAGMPNVDIRLSDEIESKVRQKTKELGFDPEDIRGEELYIALQDLTAKHDIFLAKAIGLKDPEDVQEVLPKVKLVVEKLPIPKKCWAIKQSVVRKLLREVPPKKVMKLLHYRSVESMLKRESAAEVLGAARFVESSTWMKNYIKSYKSVQPTDFESRDIEIIQLDPGRYGESARGYIQKKHRNLSHLKEMGVILLLPLPIEKLRGATITLLPLVLYYVNELRFYSSYFKYNQVRPDFAHILIDALQSETVDAAKLGGQTINWRIIQRHFGAMGKDSSPDIFEPYIQHEDFEWRSAEDVLYRLEPALKFWEGLDCIGFREGSQTIPFNLIDNAISYCNGLNFGLQISTHMRGSLWAELWSRYMGEQVHKQKVLSQLDINLPESFSFKLDGEPAV